MYRTDKPNHLTCMTPDACRQTSRTCPHCCGFHSRQAAKTQQRHRCKGSNPKQQLKRQRHTYVAPIPPALPQAPIIDPGVPVLGAVGRYPLWVPAVPGSAGESPCSVTREGGITTKRYARWPPLDRVSPSPPLVGFMWSS